jgi:hypothetical protein
MVLELTLDCCQSELEMPMGEVRPSDGFLAVLGCGLTLNKGL